MTAIQIGSRVRWFDYTGTVMQVGETEPGIDGPYTPVTIRRDPTLADVRGSKCTVDISFVEVDQ